MECTLRLVRPIEAAAFHQTNSAQHKIQSCERKELGMDRLEAMQMFVRVAEKRSFSAIARERGIGQPAVSKQISALESELGTELIRRSSKAIALTDAGRDFYESAVRLLEDYEAATSRIGRGQAAPTGPLRISVAPTFARLHMVPTLPPFLSAYPKIVIELAALGNPASMIEDGFDLAIHSGDLPDSTPIARKFAKTRIVIVATPEYLAKHGTPETPEDLDVHPAVVFLEHGAVKPWRFANGSDELQKIPTGRFRTSDPEQMRMAVLEHIGIAQAPAWLFVAELRSGAVQRILLSHEQKTPIFEVRPSGRRAPAKVQVYIEHLEKTFAMCTQLSPFTD
jgi:DNA-binding transcriptional LysR family regulator